MPFKDTNRVRYNKNPLIEVICQVRFPRILSINERYPADFQDRIRADYPMFDVSTEQEQRFAIDAALGEAVATPRLIQSESVKNYRFATDDGIWRVNLTCSFLAISTSVYSTWEVFKERMAEPIKALLEIYRPAFFERVGLRYIDAFNRQELQLDTVPWHELIQSFALGLLSNNDICDDISGYSSAAELSIDGGAKARINTALGYVNGKNDNYTNHLSFIVDSDLYFGKKTVDELDSSLEVLHGTSTKLIRALITDKLHCAMEPEEYEH